MPERVHLWARSGVYPSVPTRLIRRLGQSEARLIGESVAFTKIAPPTRRHDVVPCVRTASRPRDDVIDRLSRRRAVLTAVPVACEHGVASERHRATVGHSDKAVETDHRRHLDLHSLGSEHGVLGLEQRRLLVEHQYGCPPSRHHRKRLIRRIQNQGASHVPSSSCDRPLTPRRYHPRESSPLKCAWGPASMTGPSSGVKAPVRTPKCAVRCRFAWSWVEPIGYLAGCVGAAWVAAAGQLHRTYFGARAPALAGRDTRTRLGRSLESGLPTDATVPPVEGRLSSPECPHLQPRFWLGHWVPSGHGMPNNAVPGNQCCRSVLHQRFLAPTPSSMTQCIVQREALPCE